MEKGLWMLTNAMKDAARDLAEHEFDEYANLLNVARDIIIGQERRLENTRWIPCKERLPEKNGRYLTSKEFYIQDTKTLENEVGVYHYDPGDKLDRGWFPVAVDAWMPLPEPYKEAADD